MQWLKGGKAQVPRAPLSGGVKRGKGEKQRGEREKEGEGENRRRENILIRYK